MELFSTTAIVGIVAIVAIVFGRSFSIELGLRDKRKINVAVCSETEEADNAR